MKIQILSDLHREVGLRKIEITGDLLILAGDITSAGKQGIFELKGWLLSLEIPVIYVLGNHEYYRGEVNVTLDYFRETFEGTNVTIMDRDWKLFPDNDLLVIGATLWTKVPISDGPALQWGMNDFRVIKGMNLDWWDKEFRHSKSFIDKCLREFDSTKTTIVVTHHCPSNLSTPDRFKGNSLNAGFSTDLSELILDRKPTYWVHGHTHDSFDYTLGETRIICNPYGYHNYEINPEFKENFILEI